jgi:hypothetical protein
MTDTTPADTLRDRRSRRRPHPHAWFALGLGLLAACSGSGVTSESGTGGGGGGGSSGSGGGGQAGGWGRALSITPRFEIENPAGEERTETMRVSIPFPEGMVQDLSAVGVAGRATAWLPLQLWPDGSIRVAQAQFTDDFPASATKTYEVVRDVTALRGAFQQNPWIAEFGAGLQLRARVRDTNSKAYVAEVAALGGEVLQETPLCRVSRKRVYHQPAENGCIPRDFLSSTFYVHEFRDVPFVAIDWLLGNDYLGADDPQGSADPNLYPLGGVDVNEAALLLRGATEVSAYMPELHAVDAPAAEGGWTRFGAMRDTYVDDGQTRRYRFYLRIEHPNAPGAVAETWRRSFRGLVEQPMFGICDIDTWQLSAGLGLHGGPSDAPSDAADRALADWQRFIGDADNLGTWGAFGDVKRSNTSGTPRNTPITWEAAHAIQARSRHKMIMLQHKAWAQAMRVYHLYGLEVGAESDLYLWYPTALTPGTPDITPESLGRRELWRNDPYPQLRTRVDFRGNGWNGYDSNHWTIDAVFDYWTLSGDAWAHEELRQLGESLKGQWRLRDFPTANLRNARAEGWSMVAFVQSYLATRDASLKQYVLRRIDEIVEPNRRKDHPARMIHEHDHDPRYGVGDNTTAFPPWEHAAIMLGYLGAYKHLGSATALRIAEDVVTTIEYSWVRDYTHPVSGRYYEHGIRYATPVRVDGVPVGADHRDRDPTLGANIAGAGLNSVNQFFVSGLSVLPYYSTDAAVLQMASRQRDLLFPEATDSLLWNKWFLVCPQQYTALRNLGQGGSR